MKTRNEAARNFENITFISEIGFVKSNSIVPVFFSSAKSFIVIAGIKNINILGAILKKDFIEDSPMSNILFEPENTHIKTPVEIKKVIIAIYPKAELRKADISFLNNENIKLIYYDKDIFF